MVFDCFFAFVFIGVAQLAFAIDHDEQGLDARIIAPLFHVAEVTKVGGFVFEKPVDPLDGIEIERLFDKLAKVTVIDIAIPEQFVERPLRDADIEQRLTIGRFKRRIPSGLGERRCVVALRVGRILGLGNRHRPHRRGPRSGHGRARQKLSSCRCFHLGFAFKRVRSNKKLTRLDRAMLRQGGWLRW